MLLLYKGSYSLLYGTTNVLFGSQVTIPGAHPDICLSV